MSEISITQANVSKFSKRTKSSIAKNLGLDITHAQAQQILAEILGARNYHELQSNLNKAGFNSQNIIRNMFLELKNIFNGNKNPDYSLEVALYDNEICFNIVYKQATDETDGEVFCFFLSYLKEKKTTQEFSEILLKYYNNEPMPQNLVEKVCAFQQKFQELIPSSKIKTINGAFQDYFSEKCIDFEITEEISIYSELKWSDIVTGI